MRAHAWLSQGAEVLEQRLVALKDAPLHCDLLVVGSGYGGAVAAARLAGSTVIGGDGSEAAARVWVVERGAEYPPGRFPSRFADLPGEIRFSCAGRGGARGVDEGLFDFRLGPDVSALVGNGLGGGSLINAGVMLRPDEAVWAAPWPAGIRQGLAEAYGRAEAMLAPQTVQAGQITAKYHVLGTLGAAQPVGLTLNTGARTQTTAAGVDLAACTRCGDCCTGCNIGAKASLDTSYLALAYRHGAQMFCGVEVLRLEPRAGVWHVDWRYTARSTRRVQCAREIRARCVVLAAGTLGSTAIVLRSREALGLASPALGTRFSGNGDRLVALVGHRQPAGIVGDPESDPAARHPDRAVGPAITGMLQVPAQDDRPGFTLQDFAVPAALRQVLGESTASLHALLALLGQAPASEADDPFAVSDAALARTTLYGVMGDDGAAGEIALDAPDAEGVADAVVRWSADARAARERLGAAVDAAWSSWQPKLGGAVPLAGSALDAFAPTFTVHPLGGLPMAERGDQGAVNEYGQLFRGTGTEVHPTLAVLDGSIVPRALGINPALTIAALAERALPRLAPQFGLRLRADDAQPLPLPPRPLARRCEIASGAPSWILREQLVGCVRLAGQDWWALLELEAEPLPGFAFGLQATRRVLPLRRATLRLHGPWPAGQAPDEFAFDPELTAAAARSAGLAGSVLLFEPAPPAQPGGAIECDRIVYRLVVLAAGDGVPAPLRAGCRLEGVKTVHRAPQAGQNLWRELSAMTLAADGTVIGTVALDLGDLADRGEALIRLAASPNQPDALADLGAAALYLLRRALPWIAAEALKQDGEAPAPAGGGADDRLTGAGPSPAPADGGAGRWPGVLSSDPKAPRPVVEHAESDEEPWRLTRYPKSGRAVLLIHGLGMSGASCTHPAIPGNLALTLHGAGRDVWVLDLRSSIANETWRRRPDAADTTVEEVATSDIPAALGHVFQATGGQQVDVVAHCMGAVGFVLAALADSDPLRVDERVGRVVLSQVAPLVRLGAANRLRGFVMSYLQTYLGVDELDAAPPPLPPGTADLRQRLLDALLATFPYGSDERHPQGASARAVRVRRRADAIFGQLFEGDQIAPATFERLADLFGWAKARMLSQALHMLRLEMVSASCGRNHTLDVARVASQFGFPLLIVHGRRNRVFDWRGSLRGWRLLRRLRGLDDAVSARRCESLRCNRYGDAGLQLAVFDQHGHVDSIIGAQAHRTVFALIAEFLAGDTQRAGPETPRRLAPQAEPPWLGPTLGWLRFEDAQGGWLQVTVVVQLSQRRARTQGLVLVPMPRVDGRRVPDLARARWLAPATRQVGADPETRHLRLSLQMRATAPGSVADRYALLSLHRDLPLDPQPAAAPEQATFMQAGPMTAAPAELPPADEWLRSGQPLSPSDRDAARRWFDACAGTAALDDACFDLAAEAVRAADVGKACDQPQPLRLALASCLYTPGLFDREPAQAALRTLQRAAQAPDGPQLLLLVGDQIYADADAGLFEPAAFGRDAGSQEARCERAYELTWSLPAFRRVTSRVPVLPMLDDHEVRDNWPGMGEARCNVALAERRAALAAYRRFQAALAPDAVQQRDLDKGQSFGCCVYPAGVPLAMLDTRTQRGARDVRTLDEASPLGEADMIALLTWLEQQPRAAVKLVVAPVPLLPPDRMRGQAERLCADNWSGFPAAARRLLAHLHDKGIGRVVLLSGDAHLSSVTSWRFAEGARGPDIVAVVASGLYTPWPFVNARPDELQLEGPVAFGGEPTLHGRLHALHAAAAWARVEIVPGADGADGACTLRVALVGAAGGEVGCAVEFGPAAATAAPRGARARAARPARRRAAARR